MIGAASSSEKDLVAAIDSKITFKDDSERKRILAGLRWLGLFSTEKVSVCPFRLRSVPNSANADLQTTPRGNHLDTLCGTLEKKMQFAEGERDIVMCV